MALQSAFRNWIGVAKPTDTTVLKTAVAASAVTVVVVTATGITASTSSIIIWDGPNTEVKAVSAKTTGSLTVPALAHAHSAGCVVSALNTSGFGPAKWIPVLTSTVPDRIVTLYDNSRVGSLATKRGAQQGLRDAQWDIGGPMYADTIGYFIGGIYGSDTYTAGTPTPPNTHIFADKNTGTGQPTRLIWFVYDGVNVRAVLGRVIKLNMKWTPAKLAMYSATILARCSGVVSTTITPSFSTIAPFASWKATLSIATTFNRNCKSWEVTMQRGGTQNIPTINGTQDPLDTFVGDLDLTIKATFAKTADTLLAAFEAGTQQKFVLTLAPVSGAAGTGLKLQISKGNYDTNAVGLTGQAYNTEAVTASAIATTTDATSASTGISPGRAQLKNAVTAIYL